MYILSILVAAKLFSLFYSFTYNDLIQLLVLLVLLSFMAYKKQKMRVCKAVVIFASIIVVLGVSRQAFAYYAYFNGNNELALKSSLEYKPLYANLANEFEKQKEWQKAISLYKKLNSLSRKGNEYSIDIGLNYIRLGDLNKAKLAFYHAYKEDRVLWKHVLQRVDEKLQIEPDDFYLKFAKALSLYKLGLLERAERAFELLIKEQPGFTDSRFYLGLIYEDLDRLDKAILEYETLLDIDNRYLSAYIRLLELYEGLNNNKKVAEYRQRLDLFTETVIYLNDVRYSNTAAFSKKYNYVHFYDKGFFEKEIGIKESGRNEFFIIVKSLKFGPDYWPILDVSLNGNKKEKLYIDSDKYLSYEFTLNNFARGQNKLKFCYTNDYFINANKNIDLLFKKVFLEKKYEDR